MKQVFSISKTLLAVLFLLVSMNGCLENDEETIALPTPYTINGIPGDFSALVNPIINNPNAIIPNFQFEEEEGDENLFVYRLDMTGIMNPNTHEWMDLYGTGFQNQNVWLSLDDTPKGILVKNHSEDGTVSHTFDLVFLVDNSGSMDDEADAVARDIMNWADNLTNSGINIQFGCVGFSEEGTINGSIDITSESELNAFLNYGSGTNRTKHFGGDNASELSGYARNYGHTGGECCVMALRFADEYFHFRSNANLIYVNFTDEPNQPNHVSEWSVEYLNPYHGNWTPQQGTIHTVYSGNTNNSSQERPWLMSEYTGGTVLYASSSFTGVSLNDLPVTGAMQHSYSIYFTVPESMKDGSSHHLKVTVLSTDQTVRAERNFNIQFD